MCRKVFIALFAILISISAAFCQEGTFSGAAAGMMGGSGHQPSKKNKRKPPIPPVDSSVTWLWQRSKIGDTGTLQPAPFAFGAYYVTQLFDDDKALIWYESGFTGDETIWIFCLHSSAVADLKEEARRSKIPGFFKITGKYKYMDVSGGSHTIDLVEDAQQEVINKKITAKQTASKAIPKKQESPMRKWTDASGVFNLDAEFLGLIDGKAKLKKSDGSTITIPLNKLSDDDQDWIRKRGK